MWETQNAPVVHPADTELLRQCSTAYPKIGYGMHKVKCSDEEKHQKRYHRQLLEVCGKDEYQGNQCNQGTKKVHITPRGCP